MDGESSFARSTGESKIGSRVVGMHIANASLSKAGCVAVASVLMVASVVFLLLGSCFGVGLFRISIHQFDDWDRGSGTRVGVSGGVFSLDLIGEGEGVICEMAHER